MKIFVIIFMTCIISNAEANEYESYKLTWSPPNTYVNGEKLSVNRDLSAYKIYYGCTREGVRENSITISPLLTKFSLGDLNAVIVKKSPIIYLAIIAITKSGSESDLSEIIFFLP
jgi:hypothetical protein